MKNVAIATSFFCLLAMGAAPAKALNWVYVGVSSPSSNPQKTYIDVDSVQTVNSYVRYRIKLEINWYNTGREVVQTRVVYADCGARARYESSDPESAGDRSFKAVYQGTVQGYELDAACLLAGRRTPGASPSATAPVPAVGEVGAAPNTPLRPPPTTFGSGFAVTARHVVTNHHVIGTCASITLNDGSESMAASVLARDVTTDLAVLKTEKDLPAFAILREAALLGEDVMVAGYPLTGVLGTDMVVTGGMVNSLSALSKVPGVLQISAPVQPGNSGGPVIDRSGAIVGVVVSKLNVLQLAKLTGDLAQNVNFAVRVDVLRRFLSANSIPVQTTALGVRLEGFEQAQLVKTFTYKVRCAQ